MPKALTRQGSLRQDKLYQAWCHKTQKTIESLLRIRDSLDQNPDVAEDPNRINNSQVRRKYFASVAQMDLEASIWGKLYGLPRDEVEAVYHEVIAQLDQEESLAKDGQQGSKSRA
jgi:hypothetical protein